MKKLNFLKSVTTGVIGLGLLSNCSGAMEKIGMHKCASKNNEAPAAANHSCSSKEVKETHSCTAKKAEEAKSANHSCSTKKVETKKEANSCSSKKAK